jgi:hypothetical protein
MHSRHDTRSPFAVGLVTHDCFARNAPELSSSEESRVRSFTDDLGQEWLVSEQPFSEYDRRSGLLADLRERARRAPRARLPERLVHALRPDLAALSWRV